MFETDPNIGLLDTALRNKQLAYTMRDNYLSWKQYAGELEQQVAGLQQQLEDLKLKLAVEEAEAAGRLAQVRAWKAQHPDSPLLAASGHRFRDGEVKAKDRVVYEARFNEVARSRGVMDPEAHRVS